MQQVIEEKNKLKRMWISFWYNNSTRSYFVLLGLHLIFTLPAVIYPLSLLGVSFDFESGKFLAAILYLSVAYWAIIDNDYSNLRRIGLNERREKINQS
ncbi:hypothetical protein DZF79_02895 [Vibrio parahaemolyticus]|nr:hypothetical protein [Vibrio parahaemolyticus]